MPSTDHNDDVDDSIPCTESGDVVEDDWSEIMTTDLSAGSFAQHDTCDIKLPDGASLRIASTASLSPLDMMDLSWGTHDATGHRIWMGAELWIQALPALKLYFTSSPSGCRCLELGSGTGLAGLAVLQYFGTSTIFDLVLTDNSESALKLCRLNCSLNGMKNDDDSRKGDDRQFPSLRVELLEWGSTLAPGLANGFDVVLATDVIYDIAAWKPLVKTASELLTNGGRLIVSHVPRAALPDEIAAEGAITSEQQSHHDALESYLIRTAREKGLLWKVSLKPKDLPPFERQEDMEGVGASILVFQACSTNDDDTD